MSDQNVLIIKASMHQNGNSDLLAEELKRGAEESGNHVTEIEIRKLNLHPCLGCNACHMKGREGQCVQKDDMPAVNEQMLKADVIVFATPTYYYNMPGQLKILIDRTYAVFTELKNKDFYYLISCTDDTNGSIDEVVRAFHGFAVCLPDSHEKGTVYGLNCPNHGDIKSHDAMRQAYELGRKI